MRAMNYTQQMLSATHGGQVKFDRHATATTLNQELALIPSLTPNLNAVAEDCCKHLVEAHERFSRAVGGSRFSIVKPVVPMDIMGMYVLLPDNVEVSTHEQE